MRFGDCCWWVVVVVKEMVGGNKERGPNDKRNLGRSGPSETCQVRI